MQASEEWPDKRDMDVTYSLSDLKLLTEFSDLVLEEVSFTVGLAGLNLESIAELTDVSQSAEGNPFSALQNLLAGIEVSFTVSGLSGNHDQLDLSALHSLSAGLSLAGVNRSSQDIGLRYSHAGLRDVKGVPAELMPEHTALGLRLYQVPVVELVLASSMGSELAQDMMLEILSRSGSRLELEQLEVDLPGGGITARGRALARSQEGGDDIEQPVLDIETDLEIRGLEHLVQAVTAQMEDEEEIQQIQAVAAFIQLAAKEEERDGTSVHLLKIVGDSQGRITVNDKDLAPLFTGAGDKQGKD
ncbi:MAG: hypothetical protein U5L00_18955 [Desulfovermiculus sp.]|nr:hypothetical protein [Desulfovermiculus sp.]